MKGIDDQENPEGIGQKEREELLEKEQLAGEPFKHFGLNLDVHGDDTEDRDLRIISVTAEVGPGYYLAETIDSSFTKNCALAKRLAAEGPQALRCLNVILELMALPGVEALEFSRYSIYLYKGRAFQWSTNQLIIKATKIICQAYYLVALEDIALPTYWIVTRGETGPEVITEEDEDGGSAPVAVTS